ncbi:hypothetical protein ACH5RR_036005 [Cinchona calisaya]|uniref:Uncharacterized protein n=1 Tax=Cinchona calisaya TaxID=153742 RepID=A0ABD2Y3G6_9GENT
MAAGGWNAASNGEPMADDSQSENGSRKLMLKGRKMAFDAFTRPKKIKEIGLYEGTCITSSSTSRKEQKRVAFNAVNGQKSTRSLLSKMKELAGFRAFTADYNGPMLHPPKNN